MMRRRINPGAWSAILKIYQVVWMEQGYCVITARVMALTAVFSRATSWPCLGCEKEGVVVVLIEMLITAREQEQQRGYRWKIRPIHISSRSEIHEGPTGCLTFCTGPRE
jgi:hypothetical protein